MTSETTTFPLETMGENSESGGDGQATNGVDASTGRAADQAARADDLSEQADPDDGPDAAHRRPEGLDDATVAALGKLSEALEATEDARGSLYRFHRTTGTADLTLGEAIRLLRDAGHAEIADRLDRELLGRNVIRGRWTFQIVEDYDDGYWTLFRDLERQVREQLAGGRRHLYEAEMKESERTKGAPGHEARPPGM